MRRKSLLLTAVATLGLSAVTMAQNNCDLINSVTINAQPTQSVQPTMEVGYLMSPTQVITDTAVWHYVALTKSNSTGSFYVDGNLIYSGNFASNPYIWNSLLFGASQGCVSCSPVPTFNGILDEVRISNTARSASVISNYYLSNIPFSADANTIGLFHMDNIIAGSLSNLSGSNANIYGNTYTTTGKFGNGVFFDGIDDYARWSNSIPVNNMTIEFWIKSSDLQATVMMLEYAYNTGIYIGNTTVSNPLTWSTGATGNSVTVDPNSVPYIWVTDGNCTDTVWFDSQSATIYDTTYITVTDTLIINTSFAGMTPPNNINTIKLYPNPASTHITIDYGNFALMNGYQLVIENSLGQQMFQTAINQQSNYISLASWTGNGLYFVNIIDPQGNTIDIRKIVLQ